MPHRTAASEREATKCVGIAYTKQCINVYVIHVHVYVYPRRFFVVASLLLSTMIIAKLNNTKLSW